MIEHEYTTDNSITITGRVICGILSDRAGPLNSMIPMTTAAAVLTMAWPYAKTPASLVILAILYGIASGAFGIYLHGHSTNRPVLTDINIQLDYCPSL